MRISDWSSDVCSSDLFKHGQASSADELRVSRLTTLALGALAVLLGLLFEKQNVAFMVSLAFALAASGNFPVLILSLLWNGCTTRGAAWGGTIGLLTAFVLTLLSPAVWTTTFNLGPAPFRSEEHTSELQSLMRTSYAGFCLKKKKY